MVVPSGKDRQPLTGGERLQHLAVRLMGGLAAAALDEHGAGALAEPADQRPLPDIALGDKSGRQQRIDDEDVDEGNMVGGQQSAFDAGQFAPAIDPDAEQRQQLARPGAGQAPAAGVTGKREEQARLYRPLGQVQSDKQQAQS